MLKWATLSTFVIFLFFVANTWGYTSILPVVEVGVGGGTVVKAEVAKTQGDRERGLMYRADLASDEGMFFVFDEEGKYPFWMKNVNFPIDIVWINSDMRVVGIQTAMPCTTHCREYVSNYPARYVLEVPAGFAVEKGIKIGSRIETSEY